MLFERCIIGCGRVWLGSGHSGSQWLMVGHSGSQWIIVGHSGSQWVIVAHSAVQYSPLDYLVYTCEVIFPFSCFLSSVSNKNAIFVSFVCGHLHMKILLYSHCPLWNIYNRLREKKAHLFFESENVKKKIHFKFRFQINSFL